ncbi:hypothetical protein LKD70_15815 [Ruminococcus sp. CLA-AA-H200]|uniref:ABC-transporter type IV n=1 Tax=Ruminococcus turbiniformis TaxID=2881258 RepID=A0ABS8G0N8_9FIRM|nr:putative ABC transporter permease [Ruminococcus turbiniformis]MCC2255860.1 hypothetical protein [Ruminococcus turbiniformis]
MHSYDLTQWILFFFIYSFVGWIWESCYVSVKKRRWVNRGFMHGPMLPIYGSGALVILISTIGVRDNAALIFLLGMAGATVLEYVTGAVMERMFHVRYWDYSSQKLNLNGYVCLSSSLCWGFFSMLLVRIIHPPIESAVLKIPEAVCDIAAVVCLAAASVDFTQSFNEAMDLKRVLVQLEESREQIRKMQEKLRILPEEMLEDYRNRTAALRDDYRERAEELARKTLSKKEACLARINIKREEKLAQLEELSAKVESLLKEEIPSEISERVGSVIGTERRDALLAVRETLRKELRNTASRTDRNYLRIARHLRRNPTAVSTRFKDTMEEIRKALDTEK